jgi:hypothetical protein
MEKQHCTKSGEHGMLFNIGICFNSNVDIFPSAKNLFYWKFRVKIRIVNPLVRVRVWSLPVIVLMAKVQNRGQMIGSLFYFCRRLNA